MQITARRYDTQEVITLEIVEGKVGDLCPATELDSPNLPWIAPGLLDIQINGYNGQEFSSLSLDVEKVRDIVLLHDQFGVTGLCPTTTTESFNVLSHAVATIDQACREMPEVAARVIGIHVEGPYISQEDGPRGAHPLEHCRPPDWDEFRRLQDAASGRIILLTLSPEYNSAPDVIAKVVQSGVTVAIGHTSATSDQIRAAVEAGARLSTHLGNGAHGQIRRHPNYIWDQLAEDDLMASLIVDGHHLPASVVKSFVRAKSVERCILVSDESGLAGLPPGRYGGDLSDVEILEDGRIVIAGQRQLLAGASLPICVGISNVMEFSGVDLSAAIDMATTNPARLLGIDWVTFETGSAADFVLFELSDHSAEKARFQVRATINGGKVAFGKV